LGKVQTNSDDEPWGGYGERPARPRLVFISLLRWPWPELAEGHSGVVWPWPELAEGHSGVVWPWPELAVA